MIDLSANEFEIPLFINKSSSMPLYLQVKEQIKYMILTGKLVQGSKLPSGRQLSDFLHINRATINNALNELENEGYLKTEKGIGTYVREHSSMIGQRNHDEFKQIITNAMAEANKLGFSADEFVTAAFVLNEYKGVYPKTKEFYAIFVECNKPILDGYKRDIEDSLSIKIEPLLIDQLKTTDSSIIKIIKQAGLIITTFTHLHEVRTLLKNFPVEIIGVTAGPYLEILFKLSLIKENSKIAVVMVTNRGAIEVAQSIKDSGIKHDSLSLTSYEEKEKMLEAIKEAEVIVASSAIADDVAKYLQKDQELMTYQNTLDPASKNMLRRVISDLL